MLNSTDITQMSSSLGEVFDDLYLISGTTVTIKRPSNAKKEGTLQPVPGYDDVAVVENRAAVIQKLTGSIQDLLIGRQPTSTHLLLIKEVELKANYLIIDETTQEQYLAQSEPKKQLGIIEVELKKKPGR